MSLQCPGFRVVRNHERREHGAGHVHTGCGPRQALGVSGVFGEVLAWRADLRLSDGELGWQQLQGGGRLVSGEGGTQKLSDSEELPEGLKVKRRVLKGGIGSQSLGTTVMRSVLSAPQLSVCNPSSPEGGSLLVGPPCPGWGCWRIGPTPQTRGIPQPLDHLGCGGCTAAHLRGGTPSPACTPRLCGPQLVRLPRPPC